ncbi:hypothetical protein ONZ45_g10759 [Pleurotus djamor]|nr:hypothetical protein ONZ45_g10759 [Pleurotus djamor]
MPIRPPSPTANCAGRILSGLDLPSSGFSAVTCPSKASAAVITSKFAGAGPCRIAVDEVDRKRRSDPPTGCFPPTRTREASYSSIDSESSVASSTGDLYSPSEKPRASPIAEIDEDEDQLFPLPSPRRSPNASPVPGSHRSGSRSPSIRSTNSAPPSPANSIPPSPNGSTSCLNRSGCSSRDSLPSISSVSDEGTGPRRKCKRKSSKCEKGFLSPPDSSRARGDLGSRVGEEEEVPILAAPTPRRPRPIPDADDLSTPIASATVFPSSAPSPTSPLRSRSPSTKMRDYDGTPTRTARSISSSSSKRSRSASAQDGKRRRPSFSIPSPAHIFSDMLKGVSSMGGVTH